LPPDFLGGGAVLRFLLLGGVFERREASLNELLRSEFSSSESGFARFFVAALALGAFGAFSLGAAFGLGAAAVFFGAALGF